jgi:hypothetical protein
MIDFALEVGAKTARSSQEQDFVTDLKIKSEGFWPGIDIDLVDFPSLAERKFWARCFHDVARWIFVRKLGVHEVDFWQATAIHQARALGDLFIEAARQDDRDFQPESEDSRLFDAYHNPPKA